MVNKICAQCAAAAEVLSYAATHKIKLYWTPTNASWLNRIECHFTAMKKFALDDTDYRNHEEQQGAIDHYLSWRNGTREISLENWKSYLRSRKKLA
jgi:transposase